MRCPACGIDAIEQAIFCHKCGQRLGDGGTASPPKPGSGEASAAGATSLFNAGPAAGPNSPDAAEQEIWCGAYSHRAMLPAWVLSGIISAAFLVAGILWAREAVWWIAILAGAVLPWVYYLAVFIYRSMSVRYLLTSRRFIHERGLLRRVNNRIELLDVDDITFDQGLIERLVGVGTIRILSHDRSDPEIALRGIEDVQRVAGLFDNARLAERRRRAVHVEQI